MNKDGRDYYNKKLKYQTYNINVPTKIQTF